MRSLLSSIPLPCHLPVTRSLQKSNEILNFQRTPPATTARHSAHLESLHILYNNKILVKVAGPSLNPLILSAGISGDVKIRGVQWLEGFVGKLQIKFWWGREREQRKLSVVGSTFKSPLKRTPGQLTGDDWDEMFIIYVDTIFHWNHIGTLAVSILDSRW